MTVTHTDRHTGHAHRKGTQGRHTHGQALTRTGIRDRHTGQAPRTGTQDRQTNGQAHRTGTHTDRHI